MTQAFDLETEGWRDQVEVFEDPRLCGDLRGREVSGEEQGRTLCVVVAPVWECHWCPGLRSYLILGGQQTSVTRACIDVLLFDEIGVLDCVSRLEVG